MSKFIDADRLRAEIEKRIEATMGILHIPCHRREELEGLLSFVDSLQQEQPEVDSEIPNDLEEAADEMAIRSFPEKKSYSTVIDRVVDYNARDRENYRDGIIAGAKWQEEQDLKCISEIHRNGYNLCKEQMMKEAVAVEVVGDKRDLRLIDSTQRCLFNAKRGDWLKIIIVKED